MSFWADEIIEDIFKKRSQDAYLITDWTTPSGHAHVGSLRGVIIHDLVRRGLIEKGKKATFQFGFDDIDPMDGLPAYIDQSWKQYMGIPLAQVPAPDGKSESFAKQYEDELEQVVNRLGIRPKIVRTWDLYREGKFNEAIRTVLDNADEIRKIYREISGSQKGAEWFPLQVICPKCGKIGTTKVTAWDGKVVKFKCEENLVEWAKGCNYEGEISPFDGNAKMPWKVEWSAKWGDIEGEGKDHFAAGGSRDVANAILRRVFSAKGRSAYGGKKEPPYDIRYEHFLIGGKKMSSSKGLGVTAKDMADFLPANMLRFLFIRTRYKRAIEFNPEGEAVPLLYDEYDRVAKLYQKDPQNDMARAFYYTQTEFDKEQPQYYLRFSKIAYMLQMPRADVLEYAKEEKASEAKSRGTKDDEGAELSNIEKEEIKSRIAIAKKWLEKFAPESYKFTIAEKLPEAAKKLSLEQKEFIKKVLEVYQLEDKWTGEELHPKIHEIRKELEIEPRQAFSAIYLIFIGKDSGPQAGWLLASLEREFVIKRLEEVI